MFASDIISRRAALKFTVLYREGGVWNDFEVSKLVNNLNTDVYRMRIHPEYVILWEHFTKAQALDAIGGGFAFTAKEVVGLENPDLPWKPQDF